MKYLTDDIIKESGFDEFGHHEIAKELKSIINDDFNCSRNQTLTIGIFGKWGVGKSSVINLLRNQVLKEKQNEVVYIDIPIWKYTDTKSIRRKFIYQIAKKFNQGDEIKKLYYDVSSEGTLAVIQKIKNLITDLKKDTEKLIVYIAGFFILSLLIYVLFKELRANNFYFFINSAISAVIIASIARLISELRFSRVRETQRVFEGEEQFEHLVENCLQKSNGKKVFIIDDLDRCESNKILTVFEVIKNFLSIKDCVFLIACDPEVIRRAIDSGSHRTALSNTEVKSLNDIPSKDSRFYLEKIFQYVVEIPGFLPQNMRDYAKKIIIEADLDIIKNQKVNENIDSIVFSLIYKDTFNPRKVKILVNRFILQYNLAISLEKSEKSFLSEGEITFYPERLAFFTVLKSDFPRIVEMLKEAPSSFLKKWVKELDGHEDFKGYFSKNNHLFNQDWNVLPYIYYNNDPSITDLQTVSLENIATLNSYLRNGETQSIEEMLREDSEFHEMIQYSLNQLEILSNEVEVRNTVIVILYLFKRINPKSNIVEKHSILQVKLRNTISALLKEKNIDNEGFIAFTQYILENQIDSIDSIFKEYLEVYIQTNLEALLPIFSDKYFTTFDHFFKSQIITHINPSTNNLRNVLLLLENIALSSKTIDYFLGYYSLLKILHNRLISKEEVPDFFEDKVEIEYFKALKYCLNFKPSSFDDLFDSSVHIDEYLNQFETDHEELSSEAVSLLLGSILEICTTNDLPVFQQNILDFLISIIKAHELESGLEERIDKVFASEIRSAGFYDLSSQQLSLILEFITNCIENFGFSFKQSTIALQSIVNYFHDPLKSKMLFNWITKNYNDAFHPEDVVRIHLTHLFNNALDLKGVSIKDNLDKDFFEFIKYYLNKCDNWDDIELETLTIMSAKHTLAPKNLTGSSQEFRNNIFNLMIDLTNQSIVSFENLFLYILINSNSYSVDIQQISISSLLNVFNIEEEGLDEETNESKALKQLMETPSTNWKLKYGIFIYRFLRINTWWPNQDVNFLKKVTLYKQLIPNRLEKKFFKTTEVRLCRILSPKRWHKDNNWSSIVKDVVTCIGVCMKYHSFDNKKLGASLCDAFGYYVTRKGYVYEVISVLTLLNSNKIPADSLSKKSEFVKNMRLALKKYKLIRKGIGKDINRKFELRIGRRHFD